MRIHTNHSGFTRWLVRRSLAVLAAAAMVAVCGMVVALGAYANSHRTSHKRLAVFSHPLKRRARAAYTGTRSLPPSAVLAEIFGTDEVYVSEDAGMLCIWDIETTYGGYSCGRTTEIIKEGMITIRVEFGGQVTVGALMPNGVSSVTLTDNDGATHQLKVANNVAEIHDGNVASVRYTLPDGTTRTEKIPYHVLHPTP
jgi:hypothetical protein